MKKLSIFILTLSFSIFLSGCLTFRPLTAEELANIRSVYVEDKLPEKIHYLRLGTTVFNNKNSYNDDRSLQDELLQSVKLALIDNGYEVTESKENADITLVLDHGITYNYPSDTGVLGMGFFVHSFLGINHGVQPQSRIVFRVFLKDSDKQKTAKVVDKSSLSTIKRNVVTWDEFTEEEQTELMQILRTHIPSTVEEGLRGIGLTKKPEVIGL